MSDLRYSWLFALPSVLKGLSVRSLMLKPARFLYLSAHEHTSEGEVIGINTLIESPVSGNVGVGFAVPINIARQQLTQLQAGANLQQGYLGIAVEESTDPAQDGVTIRTVEQGSGAAHAGLEAGDIITAIDGNAIADYESVVGQINGKQPGTKVTVTIRRDGQEQQVEVTLQARPEQSNRNSARALHRFLPLPNSRPVRFRIPADCWALLTHVEDMM